MLVACHYSAAAVGADGLEVLAEMLESLAKQGKPAPAESDLPNLTYTTPSGAKHLKELSEREAEAVFHNGAPHGAPSADVQTQVDQINQQLSAVSPHAHASASVTKAGTQLLVSFPIELRAQIAAALAPSVPPASMPRAKRAAVSKAKQKKPAKKKGSSGKKAGRR